ncbi:MAG TPA: 50S ribosome-binding GTPase [archaeon]|nr:50S ribosome-binding GTPase [archaeon]
MPTNVNYEYVAATNKYENAKTDEEKVIALQEMISTAPSHKGAENLRKQLSRNLASLKNKIEKKEQIKKKSGHAINIKKEGAGQIVIIGETNSGKSTFLTKYTNAKPLIAAYPHTTTKPEVGMLNYGGANIQLIEIPSLLDSKETGTQLFSMIRVADGVVVIIKDGNIEELKKIIKTLEKKDIYITKQKPKIECKKSEFPGIFFINEQNLLIPKKQAQEFLENAGYKSYTVILNQKTSMEDLLLLINPRAVYKPAICISMPFTKKTENTNYLNIPIIDYNNEKEVRENIFKILNKIIVYTKKPGEKTDTNTPLVLNKDATVLDAAKEIHKIFYKNLKSAKVWGSSKFEGQTVSKNYVLQNGDVVEFIL